MSDYDAFGRKKDEAGLGDLGWGTTENPGEPSGPHRTVSTTASDGGLSTPTEFTPVATSPVPARRSRRNPILVLIQLAVVGAIGFGIFAAVDAGKDAANSVRDTFNQLTPPGGSGGGGGGGGGGVDRGDDTVPGQVGARKLFTAAGLRDALKVMEREVPGRIANFSMRRDYISAQIIRNGQRSIVYFTADAEVPDIQAQTSAGAVSNTLSYEQINPTAPERLMKAANARVNRSEADVEYFVVSVFSGEIQWGVYYENGSPIAIGDGRGRYLRRIS